MDLFQQAEKQRASDMLKSINYGDEGPDSIIGLKTLLLQPQLPVIKDSVMEKEETRLHSLLTKELRTSNIEKWEKESYRLLNSAHTSARIMNFDLLAAFIANDFQVALGLSASVNGWQQDKLNELRSTYNVTQAGIKENAQNAVGMQK